ncbi:MAG: site-2 protease family protein [Clostridia bacterium]|nr:site-2 protease family protein [Clostridia bacterium]
MSFNLLASFGEVAAYIGYVLIAILILLIMITVHEFGHYITGKIFKFGIEEFSIGLGPKIYSKKKKDGEVFSVRVLPIGGFCAFKGEDDDTDDPTAFNNKKPWQRIIVLFSGAFMNYILSVLVIVLMFSVYGQTMLMTYKTVENPQIASEYCFKDRDIILKADGRNVYLATDLMNAVEGRDAGELVEFTVRRDGENQKIMVLMRTDTHFSNLEDVTKLYSALGIEYDVNNDGHIINGGLYSTGVRFGVFGTIGRSFEYSFKLAGTIFKILGQLLTGALGISSLGGTVTTIAVAADAIKIGGFRYLLNITSLIGVNLAVFNLLPIPALDGSRIVFCAIEGVRKKPLNRRVEGMIHAVGLVVLLIFAVFIDLQRCF